MIDKNTRLSRSNVSLPSLNNLGINNSKDERSTCWDIKCYRMRRVKSKGAILVLLLNFLMTSIFYFFATFGVHNSIYQVGLVPFGVTAAIAGWLTDACIGRYKVIRFSVYIMWLLMIAVTVSEVIAQLNETYYHYNKVVGPALFLFVSIGLGGFQANIVQFGLDQLPDASTTEITSFIVWYVSSVIGAGFIIKFNFLCLNSHNRIYILFLICACLTLALTLQICCNHWLIKEPAIQSPFKLIYKVIKFAAVTKHPPRRSAFTYCEDELPSRIDFGKSKYGGPFTTEQVEDVKTLLRLLPLILIFAVITDVFFVSGLVYDSLEKQNNRFRTYHDLELNSKKNIAECYAETSLTSSVHLGVALLIVLNEFVLYPLFQRCICCSRIKSLQKIAIGIVLQTLRVISLMALGAISRHNNLKYNVSIQCIFFENHGLLSQTLSDQWLAIPEYLQFISLAFLFIGAIEFICSQVPYSMKGTIIGAQYTLTLVCLIPLLIVTFLVHKYGISIKGRGIISCEFWYALACLAANLSLFVILTWMAKRYKMRKREDLLPNEHFYAERYYSQ